MRLGLGLGLDRMQRMTGGLSPADVLLGLGPIVAIGSWWADSWLNASALPVADGEAIATMLDQSGFDNHYTQATGSLRPLYDADGGPNAIATAELDGLDDVLTRTITGHGAITGATLAFVVKANTDPASTSRDGAPFDGFRSESLGGHIPYDNGDCYCTFATTSRKQFNPTPSLASWNYCTVRSQDGLWDFQVNGVTVYTTATNTFGVAAALSAIGANITAGSVSWPYWGSISGTLVYPRCFTTDERDTLNGALSLITGL